ncbi:Protein-glutamate O-methyltransferase [Eumeta japonica]|uniref:Sugar phosphate phosphatase n=1 Tax=Eumeta variegata TaxID=151549 RepID=A0A4C1YGY5_EUMVA|nr:Protein-glutamate O-methyltransferase [Eumeta japonica]
MGSGVGGLAADPIRLVNKLDEQILIDDSMKVADSICARLEKMINNEKINDPNGVESNELIFDIVCDNAGYEFFTELCIAYFLINLKIVDKVRLHVKQFPWFISDTTPKDVQYIVDSCKTASFNKELNLPSTETENKVKPFHLTSDQLNVFGSKCEDYVKDGSFLIQSDDYWTLPCVFKDMKTIDPELYEKLRQPMAVLVKGDLNYRKLLGDKNWIPTTEFETALEGFHPAPIIATRAVKCEIICGLTSAEVKKTKQYDPKWMETGDYGSIDNDRCVLRRALRTTSRMHFRTDTQLHMPTLPHMYLYRKYERNIAQTHEIAETLDNLPELLEALSPIETPCCANESRSSIITPNRRVFTAHLHGRSSRLFILSRPPHSRIRCR